MVGVSKDSAAAHARFRAKLKLPYRLLADPKLAALRAFGVWKEKTMYGRKVMGVERTTMVLDTDGRIRRIFAKVKVKGHAAEVLAALG